MASSIPAAASGGLDVVSTRCFPSRRCLFQTYGTKMAEAVAPVSFTASLTVANTGRSKCVDPAFLGFVPPTTWVPCMYEHISFDQVFWGYSELPYAIACSAWKLASTNSVSPSPNLQSKISKQHSRSLFTSETLEEDTSLIVYAKVADCRRVC